jgi:hypothetical protein
VGGAAFELVHDFSLDGEIEDFAATLATEMSVNFRVRVEKHAFPVYGDYLHKPRVLEKLGCAVNRGKGNGGEVFSHFAVDALRRRMVLAVFQKFEYPQALYGNLGTVTFQTFPCFLDCPHSRYPPVSN